MIGVFDSGIGGLSVLRALRAELPAHDFSYFADTGYAPYGGRDDTYIVERSRAVARTLIEDHAARMIVVACNTATAAAVHMLRSEHPTVPIVGVEPALKPAAAVTRTKRVGVMATRFTIGSAKLRALQESLKGEAEFVLQPCDGLVEAIESDDAHCISQLCEQYTRAMGTFGVAPGCIDTLVLGCTHYVFAQQALAACIGTQVTMLETGEPVARRARRVLDEAGPQRDRGTGRVKLLTTGSLHALESAALRWARTHASSSPGAKEGLPERTHWSCSSAWAAT